MKSIIITTLFIFLASMAFSCKQSMADTSSDPSRYYTDSIFSKELRQYRKHDIYLPEGFDPEQRYPILYAADGQFGQLDDYLQKTLDSLILHGHIPPLIYAGSHSNTKAAGESSGQDQDGNSFAMQFRFFEYVEVDNTGDIDPELDRIFDRHLDYFAKEFIPAIESEFGQNAKAKDRFFYGVSNGAGFGANLLNKRPQLIGTFICYSTLGSNVDSNKWNSETTYPDLYLQYGDQEAEAFAQEAKSLQSRYQDSESYIDLQVYQGGHEESIWKTLLPKTLTRIYNNRTGRN